MRKIIIVFLSVFLGSQIAFAAPATQDSYCFAPPYLSLNATPNINFIIDASGSMQQPAFMPSCSRSDSGIISGCTTAPLSTGATGESYLNTKKYYGYWDSTKFYKYTAAVSPAQGYFQDNTASCSTYVNSDPTIYNPGSATASCISGNLINWISTTRVDTVRKILTGGRVKSGSATTTTVVLESDGGQYIFTDPNLKCKFTVAATNNSGVNPSTSNTLPRTLKIDNQGTGASNACSIGTLSASNTSVLAPLSAASGVIQDLYPLADLEVLVFSGNLSPTATWRVGKGQTTVDPYVNALNSELPGGATPTGDALKEAQKFFQQNGANAAVLHKGYFDKDPYYVSDGASPTPHSVAAYCKKAFNILISDGAWSTVFTSEPSPDKPNDPIKYVYDMRLNDQRPDATEAAMKGAQNVTTYTVYTFGDGPWGKNSMMAMAIFGGWDKTLDTANATWPYPFTDLPNDSRNNVGNTTANTIPWALMNKCNPAGTYSNSCKSWDKSGTGVPYNFFQGSDGAVLEQQIKAAVISILNQLSSGTAASILGNNDNNGATLLQALFFPTKQFTDPTSADWVGELQSFWYYLDPLLTNINIREDTVKDNKLKLSEDHIAEFSFDAVNSIVNVNLFNDNGSGGKGTAAGTVTVDNVKTIWNAGTSLWARTASDRTIYANDPSVTTDSRVLFTSTNQAKFTPYLDVASDAAKAGDVLNFIRGENVTTTGYRSRQVTTTDTTLATPAAGTHVWKLGDIINSTPKLLSKGRLNSFDTTYKDKSYGSFINSINLSDDNSALYDGYKKRGTAFVGANDGMLHAFNIGVNFTGTAGYVSELKNSDGSSPATNLGKELWGFIPKNAMPYLKHFGAIGYKHLFYVDATPLLIDASIGITKYKYYDTPPSTAVLTCTSSTYYDCPKVTTTGGSGSTSYVSYNSTPDPAAVNTSTGTSWRTVLLGAMGYGGATRESTSSCSTTTDCVKVPPDVTIGYSSYFALDVTKQDAPALLWEFGNPLLGYSTVGASVVRIKSANDTGSPVARNGRWFAVLASGPTGPVDTTSRQMKAFSDQPLRIFVLDLKTGAVLRTFSNEAGTALSGMPAGTHFRVPGMPSNAFAGSLSNATIDTDQWDLTRAGSYSDDAIYVNYSRKNTDSADAAHGLGKFSEGGILRILTGDNPDPSKWKVSTVIDGVGPITSGIAKLQDKAKGTLWLYFGTGRYYYKTGLTIDEDYGSPAAQNQQLAIYGIKEPCYNSSTNDLDKLTDANGVSDCVTQIGTSANPVGSLDNRTTTSSAASTNGWFINLALESTSFKAQRVISDPVATSTGTVFFTAFKPSTDFCGYGGDSSLWAVSYDTGGALGGASGSSKIAGQALMQLSTGAFQQVDLHATFGSGSRESASFKGVPPKSPPAITSNADHFPSKRVLHIMER